VSDLAALIPAARGKAPADLVLKGGWVVNVFSGKLEKIDLAIKNGIIVGLGHYSGKDELDVSGGYVSPGLIEPRLIEPRVILATAWSGGSVLKEAL